MSNSTEPTYAPQEALVLDLKDFICRNKTRLGKFNAAVASAIENGQDDMEAEGIKDLNGYLKYCDELLRWIPTVKTTGDALLRKILVFYWVFDQPTILDLQTPISPETSNIDLSWLSYWLVSFARQQGQFLNTPASGGAIYTLYLNTKYNPEAPLWEQPKGGWKSFNDWFSRSWKNIEAARPLDSPDDDKVIVMPADSVHDGNWPIKNGKIDLTLTIKGIGYKWPIKDLLRTESTTWDEGHFTHSFLGPTDYHRQHSPVSGEVIEARVIQNQVYLQVATNTTTGKLYADRAMVRAPAEVQRRRGVRVEYESDGQGGDGDSEVGGDQALKEDLDAPDDPGYQWCQTRGLVVIQTEKYGKVAILPIGMAQVSSVVLCVKEGQHVQKGQNISYFQFGGSDCVMVFERRVDFKYPPTKKKKINVRKEVARFKSTELE
ncbi:hypothetical protein N7478_012446 [Penicillium angulare]|uniref:uncharacterized protein n=1 Tax=Penicillium angulare TaxID=116970 RepID=UPI002540EE3C|nr:uncharacterized protein N7478_012446 [Penicillium angulare]KAJ5259465.1 hypothetical protein N7478_012446 [Penicillium angulare]